jgi:hypothetical protein
MWADPPGEEVCLLANPFSLRDYAGVGVGVASANVVSHPQGNSMRM